LSLAVTLDTAAGWPPSTTSMWRTAEQVVPAICGYSFPEGERRLSTDAPSALSDQMNIRSRPEHPFGDD